MVQPSWKNFLPKSPWFLLGALMGLLLLGELANRAPKKQVDIPKEVAEAALQPGKKEIRTTSGTWVIENKTQEGTTQISITRKL